MALDAEDIHSTWNKVVCDLLSQEKCNFWWKKINRLIDDAKTSNRFFGSEFIRQKLGFVDEYKEKLKCDKSVTIAILLQYLHYESKLHGLDEEKTLETFAELRQDCIDSAKHTTILHQDEELVIKNILGNPKTSLYSKGEISEDNHVVLDNLERLLITAITNSAGIFLDSTAFGDLDEHYFLDFDSAILGSSSEAYKIYAKLIREEYETLSDAQYGKLRKRVLQEMMTIPNIFATREFRDLFEAQSRENIQEEIATLA